MGKYVIYKAILPSVTKVGCTKNLDNRKSEYPDGTLFEILTELYDVDDKQTGDIEWEWADKLGTRRGRHYTISMNARSIGGKKSNNKGKMFGNKYSIGKRSEQTRERMSIAHKDKLKSEETKHRMSIAMKKSWKLRQEK